VSGVFDRAKQLADTDWLQEEPPPPQWLLTREDEQGGSPVGVYRRGALGLFGATGGTGKTWMALDLAVAVASGEKRRWLHYNVQASGPVFVLLGEEDETVARERITKVVREHVKRAESHEREQALKRIEQNLVFMAGHGCDLALQRQDHNAGGLVPTEALASLHARLEDCPDDSGWALVILDPFSRIAPPGAEVDNAIATATVTALEGIGRRAPGNPCVLVTHHTSQSAAVSGRLEADAIRGVSALKDGPRWAFVVQPLVEKIGTHTCRVKLDEREVLKAGVAKSNHAPRGPVQYLVRTGSGGMVRAVEEDELRQARKEALIAAKVASSRQEALEKEAQAEANRRNEEAPRTTSSSPRRSR